MAFVVYNSVEDVKEFQSATERVVEHFGSEAMAEKYLDGLIDWDGHEICGYCKRACYCPVYE